MKNMKHLVWIISFLFIALTSSHAQAFQVPSPLVETGWLADNINNVVILDVRKDDLAAFTTTGHIPGAALVNWANVRSNRMLNGVYVQYIIPTQQDFNALMQAAGVNQDSAVVITSKSSTGEEAAFATRLYWSLKYYGFDNAAVLNGGTTKWINEKRAVSLAASAPVPGNFTASTERMEIFGTTEDVLAALDSDVNKNKYKPGKDTQLVDGRELNYYLGSAIKPYVYARGHIPTGKDFPLHMMVNAGAPATFTPTNTLLQAIEAMGIDPYGKMIIYCNSGHEGSALWFFLHEIVGNQNVSLYDGSMAEWTLDPSRPVVYMKWE
jgi:thiosulfate/3-mercaptopyruvate sulfurtransferase